MLTKINALPLTYRILTYVGLGVLLLIILKVIYNKLFKKINKEKYIKQITEADLREIPDTWNPSIVVEKLYSAMSGLSDNQGKKTDAFATLNALTDAQVKVVASAFNDKYVIEGNGTLTDWIDDEWVGDSEGLQKTAVERLINLGFEKADPEDVKSWYSFW